MNHTSVAEIGLITTAEHAASTHVPELHAIELAQLAYAAWRFEYGEGDDGEPS